jgi:hypothetical protein
MSSNSQSVINQNGVVQYTLGGNITDLPHVEKIRKHPDFKLFDFSSSEKYFNSVNTKAMHRIDDSIDLKYIFLIGDDNGVVKKITIIVDDSRDLLVKKLKADFGEDYLYGDVKNGSETARSYYYWTTKAGATIGLRKRHYDNPLVNYPVSVIEIYYPKDLEKLMDFTIDIRTALPENLRLN